MSTEEQKPYMLTEKERRAFALALHALYLNLIATGRSFATPQVMMLAKKIDALDFFVEYESKMDEIIDKNKENPKSPGINWSPGDLA